MKITGRHLLVLIGMCGLLASGVGLVTNVAGLFLSPIAEEFGILSGAASLTMTVCNVSFAIGGLFAPRFLKEGSFKATLIAGTAILAGATAALSLCPSIMPIYVLCVARGLAAGTLGFVFVTSVLNQWFVSGVGLATSIAMACSGLAGAAFSPIVGAVVSGAGWRAGYILLAVLTVALNLPAILFLPSLDPRSSGFQALGADEAPAPPAEPQQGSAAAPARPIKPLVFAAVFAFGVFASAVTALPQHFPTLAELYGLAGTGATMLSVCMVANSLGKIVFGALVDKLGNRTSTIIYSGIILGAMAILLVLRVPGAMVVAAMMYGLCYALGTVSGTMLTRDAFGLENYGKVYPVVSLAGAMSNAVFSSVIGFMYDFSGGYASTIIMLAAMVGAGIAITVYVYAVSKEA